MSTPTTLRAELMKAVETFNDRYFLTMGDTGAGASPYNPIQPGLGAQFVAQVDKNVQSVEMFMHRVGDMDVAPIQLNPTKNSDSTWLAEGAIGGALLGFPQPAPSYAMPQCFELTVVSKNKSKSDTKVYTFWVGEGVVGTIATCTDRKPIGTKPLIAGFDGVGWHDFGFADNYAEFYAKNNLEPFVSNDDALLKGLLEDTTEGVYVPGDLNDIFNGVTGVPAPADPWVRAPEPPVVGPLTAVEIVDRNMAALRAGFGAQWKYKSVPVDEHWQHGTVQKARRSAPAAVHAAGTGIADNLGANPQLGNDIGGAPAGPNTGFPRGINGARIDYVSGESWGPGGSDDFIFNVVVDSWVPTNLGGNAVIALIFGEAADWVGGGNLGGFIELQGANPAHLLCSIKTATPYYGPPTTGQSAWPAAGVRGGLTAVPLSPGVHQIAVRRSVSGVPIVNGTVYAVQVMVFTGALVTAGGGYFGEQYAADTLRTNALRLIAVP